MIMSYTPKWLIYLYRRLRFGKYLSRIGRSEYQTVWDVLSINEEEAKIHVSGYTDEADIVAAAHQTLNMLQSTVGINSSDVILEIGSGVGRVGQAVAPLCKQWIGTDVSKNMIRHTKHRLREQRNVLAVHTNGHDLSPIETGSVDLVYCTVVFMHLEEWDRYNYIKEGHRVLRPGGRMLVDNFNIMSNGGWNIFIDNLSIAPKQRPPHISKSSTPQELVVYFQRAGFHDIRVIESDTWITVYGTVS